MVRMTDAKFKKTVGRHNTVNGSIKGKDTHGEGSTRFDQSHDSSQLDSADNSSQDGGQMSAVSAEDLKAPKDYGPGRGNRKGRGPNKLHS